MTVLVTGNSGSGKSSLLPYVIDQWPQPATVAVGQADRSKPLIDCWWGPPERNVSRLSAVGLGDAFLWCRTYAELSEGQKARFDAADLLFGNGTIVVIDEFLNALDRTTAKAVAWSIGNLARRLDRGFIVATSQDDIRYDLGPDLHIKVGVDPEPVLERQAWDRPCCSVHDSMKYRPGDATDWKQLKHLHYAAGDPATVHSSHVLTLPEMDHPAAVMILSYPDLHSAPRNLALRDYFRIGKNTAAARKLNQEMLRLSRIVVAPEVRTAGLARRLISETVARVDCKYMECITAMGRYNRFLLKAGFREIPQALHPIEDKWMDYCTQNSLDGRDALDPDRLRAAIDRLSVRRARQGRQLVWSLYHHFVLHRRTLAKRPERTADLDDPRWSTAFDLAARRILDRPAYFLLDCDMIRGGTWETPVD